MQRKPTKNTRGPNKGEKDFQAWLKERPCCVSGKQGVSVHHMYGSSFKHNKILIGHLACIPLHYDFHQGKWGIHTIGINAWVEAHDRQAVFFHKEQCEYYKDTGILLPGEEAWAIREWGR